MDDAQASPGRHVRNKQWVRAVCNQQRSGCSSEDGVPRDIWSFDFADSPVGEVCITCDSCLAMLIDENEVVLESA